MSQINEDSPVYKEAIDALDAPAPRDCAKCKNPIKLYHCHNHGCVYCATCGVDTSSSAKR